MSIVVIIGVAALMVIGMIGAFMFILIQLVLLVDFAHAWNERWLGNYEESQSRVWFTGILLYAFVLPLLLQTNYIVIMIRALDLCSSGIVESHIESGVVCINLSLVSPHSVSQHQRAGFLCLPPFTYSKPWIHSQSISKPICSCLL